MFSDDYRAITFELTSTKFGIWKLGTLLYCKVQKYFDTLNCLGLDNECVRRTDRIVFSLTKIDQYSIFYDLLLVSYEKICGLSYACTMYFSYMHFRLAIVKRWCDWWLKTPSTPSTSQEDVVNEDLTANTEDVDQPDGNLCREKQPDDKDVAPTTVC